MESLVRAGLNWAKVMRYSGELGVQSLLYKHLCQDRLSRHVPEPVLHQLKQHYCTQSIRSLRIVGQIEEILSALKPCNVPIVLLKGAFLARWLYEDIALRPMSDIDILCRKCDQGLIQNTLIGMGYYQERSLFRSAFQEAVQSGGCHHLLPFRKADAHVVELHTHLFSDDRSSAWDMDRVWQNVIDTQFDDSAIKCLSLDYQLLYLCLHLYHHLDVGKIALYWFCDIHEMILRYREQIDWDHLKAMAHSLGVADRVESVFDLLRVHWKTQLPEKDSDGAGSLTPGFCLAAILDNQLYEKSDEIRLLSDYGQEIKFVFQMKGWANRVRYFSRLIFPTGEHLRYRYKLTHPLSVGLCYLLLPFIRFKNLTTSLFYRVLFQLEKPDRCALSPHHPSDPKPSASSALYRPKDLKSGHDHDRS